MLRKSLGSGYLVPTIAILALVVAAFAVIGCGNSSTAENPPISPSAPAQAVHTSATGTAVTDKLAFTQLTLESTPQASKDSHGLEFVKFRYADNDGKVYECILPKAQSEGQYTLSEWSATFAAYRLPKVVAQKKIAKREDLGDYPFISPRPQTQAPAQTSAAPTAPPPAPTSVAPPPLPAPMPPHGSYPGTVPDNRVIGGPKNGPP